MKRLVLMSAGFMVFCFLTGCFKNASDNPSPESAQKTLLPEKSQGPAKGGAGAGSFKPFVIYSDKASNLNHYAPSGFMPDGKCIRFDDAWAKDCHSGRSCIKVEYDVVCSKGNQKWAGIYWLNPPNNWGKTKGGFNLTGAAKLTFWAKGEKGHERLEEVKMGGLTGDYPDSDTAVIGPVLLANEWKQYTIDLRGKDLSLIAGGFAWATNVDVNPQDCTFYFDDIQYE